MLTINNIKNGKIPEEDLKPFIRDTYELYQNFLKRNKAFDYNDLIINTIKIFSHFSFLRKKYQESFSYILIDEAQDLNSIQWKVIELLMSEKQNVFIVGDPNQAIYGFQGSSPVFFFNNKECSVNKIFFCKLIIVRQKRYLMLPILLFQITKIF